MKKQTWLIMGLMVILMASQVTGKKMAVLDEITRPDLLEADESQLYVCQGSTVYIYSLKDFKLVKKFGTRGQGPQEFVAPIRVNPVEKGLWINSIGKISFYTKDGTFKKEQRVKDGFSRMFFPVKNNFTGFNFTQENGTGMVTVNLYNDKLEKIKELTRFKNFIQRGAKVNPLGYRESVVQVLGDRIFFNYDGLNGFQVFDAAGKKLKTIVNKLDRPKITDRDKKEIHECLRIDPRFKRAYENLKHRIEFPAYFPSFYRFIADGTRVYALTYKQEKGASEFLVFDRDGKYIQSITVPFHRFAPHFPSPFTISSGNLYQLVENLDDSEWELHVNKMK